RTTNPAHTLPDRRPTQQRLYRLAKNGFASEADRRAAARAAKVLGAAKAGGTQDRRGQGRATRVALSDAASIRVVGPAGVVRIAFVVGPALIDGRAGGVIPPGLFRRRRREESPDPD